MGYRAVIKGLLLLLFLMPAAQAAAPDATEVVKSTATRIIDRLNQQKSELQKNPERIYDLIKELVIPQFDFAGISRWVLGNETWQAAEPGQREAFIEQFQTLLIRTYAKALLEYSEQEILYHPARTNDKGNLAVVRTEVRTSSGSTGSIPIHYRMHLKDGAWKVLDVAVDGVSLVSTYRGSFASEIRKNGLDTLISRLQERNNKLQGRPAETSASSGSAN